MPRRSARRRNPDPDINLVDYLVQAFSEVLKARGAHIFGSNYRLADLPSGERFEFTAASISLPPFRDDPLPMGISVTVFDDDNEHVEDLNKGMDTIEAEVQRAADATRLLVYVSRIAYDWKDWDVYVPKGFPKRNDLHLDIRSEKRSKARVLKAMTEFHFLGVPRQYRRQIGALVLSAFETNDLGIYMQAKELAAMVAT